MIPEGFDADDCLEVDHKGDHFVRVYNAYKAAEFSHDDAMKLASQALDSWDATP